MIPHPDAEPPGDFEARLAEFERRFAALDLAALAAMVGVDDFEAGGHFADGLRKALSGFYDRLWDKGPPMRRQMRAELTAIEHRALALLATLRGLHSDTWIEMHDGYAMRTPEDFDWERWDKDGFWFADAEWETMTASIGLLAEIAAEARENLRPARRGRREDYPLRAIVAGLARLYEAHSGQPARAKFSYDPISGDASSPFLAFVQAALSSFAPEFKRSNNALAEAMRRTVGDRARSNGKKG